MIRKISQTMTNVVSKYLPNPLIFAMILTLIVFICALFMTPKGPVDMVNMWGDGIWNLLGFAMQMALIVITGHALASSGPVKRFLTSAAMLAKTPAQGVMLVTFFGAVASAFNWGFGLVVGAMFAREVAKRVANTDYRLLIASAYIGFMTWHGGLSGSIPLLAATPGNPIERHVGGVIPVTDTLFTTYNIFITLALIFLLPFLTRLMIPADKDVVCIDPSLLREEVDFQRVLPANASIAEKLEESKILSGLISLIGVTYLVLYFYKSGFNITINTVNLIFLVCGLILHKTPMAYMRAVSAATAGTAGIIIQFPFYASIQLMMEHSGLGGLLTQFFVDISTKETFPILTFFSSGLVNLAVPSGGGHWVVQGPYVIPAAKALGADMGKAAMAIAYGETWMNMVQPFWALPALAIAGLGVRDIMGFCVTALLFTTPIFIIGLML